MAACGRTPGTTTRRRGRRPRAATPRRARSGLSRRQATCACTAAATPSCLPSSRLHAHAGRCTAHAMRLRKIAFVASGHLSALPGCKPNVQEPPQAQALAEGQGGRRLRSRHGSQGHDQDCAHDGPGGEASPRRTPNQVEQPKNGTSRTNPKRSTCPYHPPPDEAPVKRRHRCTSRLGAR